MRPLHLFAISVTLTGSLIAQSTTWTSFEDRRGHTIAASPTAGVLMFGGESVEQPGKLLGNTAKLEGNTLKRWTEPPAHTPPSPRTEHAMAPATIAGTASFIVFGGATSNNGPTNETFCFDGSGWGKIDPPAGASVPSARTGHAMATDQINNKVYLFGGFTGAFPVDDLWQFDPATATWTQLPHPAQAIWPLPRFGHAMAWYPLTNSIYLFGGSGFLNDTWRLDLTTNTWTQLAPTTSPPGLVEAAMAYHGTTNRIVLFGGRKIGNIANDETWIFDPFTNDWSQATPTTSPPGRYDHALSGDALGQELVLLGGTDGTNQKLNGTWFWDGFDWHEELAPPSPRTGVAMAYDTSRDVHVLFGGRDAASGTDLSETWELDGLNWRLRTPSAAPTPRADAGLVYDQNRDRTVLFGGRSGGVCGTPLGDTWEWNGGGWTLRTLPNNPPATGGVQPVFDSNRNVVWMLVGSDMWMYDGTDWTAWMQPLGRASFSACYDSMRDRFVVFGGDTTANAADNDTWEWDGQRWRRLYPTTSPPGRRAHEMVYHTALQKSLLIGGWDGANRLGDVWEWDGTNWTQTATIGPRSDCGVAYDTNRSTAIVVSGWGTSGPNSDYWERSAAQWTSFSLPIPGREGAALAFDSIRNKTLYFGGSDGGSYYNNTWLYDGSSWTSGNPSTSPPPRAFPGVAFDTHTGTVILFGGFANSTYLGDTWSWDGSDWTQLTPATSPSPRTGAVIFSTGTRTLLFGGSFGFTKYNDLWEWDGTNWTRLTDPPPSSRTNYGAAYDKARDRVVIFGGREDCASGNYLNETWEWDGDSWLQRFPTIAPSPRERAQLTYDEARGRVVLFGGTDGTNTFDDTWEWDGNEWLQRQPTQSPPGSAGHSLTFDRARRLTVAFGSMGGWDYGPTDPPTITSHPTTSTCTGSNGPITLQPTYSAGPWLGDRIGVNVVNAPLVNIAVMIFGFSNQTWNGTPLPLPLFAFNSPLCELNIEAAILDVAFPLTTPYLSPAMPSTPSLVGTTLFLQGAFFDGGLPGMPLITSDYLEMTLGAK